MADEVVPLTEMVTFKSFHGPAGDDAYWTPNEPAVLDQESCRPPPLNLVWMMAGGE